MLKLSFPTQQNKKQWGISSFDDIIYHMNIFSKRKKKKKRTPIEVTTSGKNNWSAEYIWQRRRRRKKRIVILFCFAKISWHIEGVAAFATPSFRVIFQGQTKARLNRDVHSRTRAATTALGSTSGRGRPWSAESSPCQKWLLCSWWKKLWFCFLVCFC